MRTSSRPPGTKWLVGIISDTHGLLRPQALDSLRGSQLIVHAGDIGAPRIFEALASIAPVRAARGNIDVEPWAEKLPETEVIEIGGVQLYVLHDLKRLDLSPRAAGFAAVISGHSHQPGHRVQQGVLHFNPGSAGPRRFRLPVTVGRIQITNGRVGGEVIRLAV